MLQPLFCPWQYVCWNACRMISISAFRTIWQNKHGVWCGKSILFHWLFLIYNEFQMLHCSPTLGDIKWMCMHWHYSWSWEMKPWWTTGLLIYAHTLSHTQTHTHTLLWTSSMNQEPELLSLSNQQSAQAQDLSGNRERVFFFPPLLICCFYSDFLMAVFTSFCTADNTSTSWNSFPIIKGNGKESQLHLVLRSAVHTAEEELVKKQWCGGWTWGSDDGMESFFEW